LTVKVSVVVPTFDRPRLLRRAVAAILAQDHGDLELLIVTDGAGEDTLAVADDARGSDPRVRVLRAARHGNPALPREIGLRHATGDAIAYCDDDDTWDPAHLSTLVAACDADRPVVVSGAAYRTEDGVVLRRLAGRELTWHPEIAAADPYAEPSRVLHLRGLPERVGGWRDLGAGLEDWDLWWRLTRAGMRFTPVARATATLTVAGTTRRGGVRCAFALPVAEAGDEPSATEAAASLGRPSRRLHDALHADLDAWGAELSGDARTVSPLGLHDGDGRSWTLALAESAIGPTELVPVRLWGRWYVAIPLWCADARHARQAERILRRRQARQIRALGDLASERSSGGPPEPASYDLRYAAVAGPPQAPQRHHSNHRRGT
jgi:Glycosyl transferase family 2